MPNDKSGRTSVRLCAFTTHSGCWLSHLLVSSTRFASVAMSTVDTSSLGAVDTGGAGLAVNAEVAASQTLKPAPQVRAQ